MAKWRKFSYPSADYDYGGQRLADAWPDLHRGDREPFPGTGWVEAQLQEHPHAAPENFDGAIADLAQSLEDAWRHFHAGRFEDAVQTAIGCGLLGANCANKSTGIYASYLEEEPVKQQALFKAAITRAELAREQLPHLANCHYFLAFNLGRLSQSMSVMDALRQGMGGKILDALEQTLALQPDHAEAHTALGMYHAEVINKVGKMIGAMTYGASADKAREHFERAIELAPDSPIAHIEYGNGLYLLHGDRELDAVTELYVKASEMEAKDAMERLDIESARNELE